MATSDVASILEGTGVALSPAATTTTAAKAPPRKPPKGMSREVFALLDPVALAEGVPPVAVAPAAGRKFKIEPGKKARSWAWSEFQNSARADGVRLKHWQRQQVVLDDYAFTRFNKAPYVPLYSDEQYAALIAPLSTSESWSRADTDELFCLCRRYDLRWPVIHDRFTPTRALVDLKQRFYSVASMLCSVAPTTTPCRALLGDMPRTAQPTPKVVGSARSALAEFKFDAGLEHEHESRYDKLFTRSQEDEAEELRLAAEFKRVEAELKRALHEEKTGPPMAPTLIEPAAAAATSQQVTLRSTQLDKRPNAVGVGRRMTKKMADLMDALQVPQELLPSLNVATSFNALRLDAVKLMALEKTKLQKQAELAALLPSGDASAYDVVAADPISVALAPTAATTSSGAAGLATSPAPTPVEDKKRKASAMAAGATPGTTTTTTSEPRKRKRH